MTTDELATDELYRHVWTCIQSPHIGDGVKQLCLHIKRELELEANVSFMIDALKRARRFIVNGVEFGYIRLPDQGDPALETLPAIEAAIAQATR